MKPRRKLLPVCAAMVALGALSSQPANALMMTQPWQNFIADGTLTFNQFNPALGTLTGVEFLIDSNWSTNFSLDYSGPEGSGGQISGSSSHSVKFASDASAADMGTMDLGSLSVPGCTFLPQNFPDGKPDVECHQSDDGNGVISGDVATLFSIVFDPADYIGVGTFDVNLTRMASVDSCTSDLGEGDPTCTANTYWDNEEEDGVTVKYTYDEPSRVPEPGSMALLGLALAGLGVARRLKR